MDLQTTSARACISCGVGLSADAHGNRKRCEKCAVEHSQEYARKKASDWYYANTDRAHTSAKNWRAANPEKMKAYHATWLAKPGNKEKAKTWVSAWCKSHRDRMHEYWQRWYIENQDVLREVACDRARLRAALYAGSNFQFEDWLMILEVFGHRCAYCNCDDLKLTMDHVIAISRGGAHTVDNVVPACVPCNSRKKNRPVWVMVNAA